MNKRQIGSEYEEVAVSFLEGKGFVIKERNFYTYFGEIDIIALDGEYFVFVEVKYRRSSKIGFGEEAISYNKRKRIYKSAQYYLYKNRLNENVPCRFDVVAINGKDIILYKNAYGMEG